MKKIIFTLLLVVSFSCSKEDNAKIQQPVTYSATITTNCPSSGTSGNKSYCVSQSTAVTLMERINEPNNGCIRVRFRDIENYLHEGYLKSVGGGCN